MPLTRTDRFSAARVLMVLATAFDIITFLRSNVWIGRSFALAVNLVVLVWYLARRHRQKLEDRRERGLCVKCGYDLHESVTCCSECGYPLPPGHRATSDVLKSLTDMQQRR